MTSKGCWWWGCSSYDDVREGLKCHVSLWSVVIITTMGWKAGMWCWLFCGVVMTLYGKVGMSCGLWGVVGYVYNLCSHSLTLQTSPLLSTPSSSLFPLPVYSVCILSPVSLWDANVIHVFWRVVCLMCLKRSESRSLKGNMFKNFQQQYVYAF